MIIKKKLYKPFILTIPDDTSIFSIMDLDNPICRKIIMENYINFYGFRDYPREYILFRFENFMNYETISELNRCFYEMRILKKYYNGPNLMIQLLREDYVIMLPISRCCIRFYGSGNRGHHLLFIFGVDTERKIFFCKDFSERRCVEFEVSFDEIKRSLDIYFREFSRESDGLLAIKVNPNSSTEIDYSKVYCEFYKLKQSFYTNEAGYGVGAINLMIYDVKRRPDEYTNADSLRNISFYLLEASKLLTYRYRIFSDEIVKHKIGTDMDESILGKLCRDVKIFYYQIEKLSLKGSEISMDMMTSLCKMMETCRDDFYEIADYICNLISTFEKKRYRLF